jgi:hypothetical protein
MTELVSRRHSATVAGDSCADRSAIQVCMPMWSIFARGQEPHCGRTWVRMIDASRAWVVALRDLGVGQPGHGGEGAHGDAEVGGQRAAERGGEAAQSLPAWACQSTAPV